MKTLLSIIVATVLAVGIHTDTARAATITQIVAASGGTFDNNRFDYDILLNAVITANLADALNDPSANLTVFAPNDLAFIRLARDLGYAGTDESGAWTFLVAALTSLGGGDPIPVLTNVLLYHVVPQRVNAFQFLVLSSQGANVPTLLTGATIRPAFYRIIDNDPDLKNPNLFLPLNLNADNGIIHTIDRVLIPLNLP